MNSPSLLARAVLAIVLMIGFYTMALAIAAVLIALPVIGYVEANRIDLRLAIFGIGGGVMILWSILPRPGQFHAPGPRLSEAAEPALFREVRSIAQATGQPMPTEVYLVPDVNAWVAHRGGWMGRGGHRVMGLGLPLVQALTVPELRAVLAHEFGHFYGGDTAVGPWVWTTRAALGRTIGSFSERNSFLRLPFLWYGKLFLRITHAISRRQEYSADALAARTEGAAALAEGLKKVHGAAMALNAYLQSEVAPILRQGFRPPLAEGFARFLSSPGVATAVATGIDSEMRAARKNPYDTHPPLPDRIAALQTLPAVAAATEPRPAIQLISDLPALERSLLSHMIDPNQAERLKPLAWEALGEKLLLPEWESNLRSARPAIQELTFDSLPVGADAIREFAQRLPQPTGQASSLKDLLSRAAWVLGGAIGLALARRGWQVAASPGSPIMLTAPSNVPEASLDLSELMNRIWNGSLDGATWRARCEQLGLTGVRVAP